jgi:cell division septation protein DedD
MTAHVRARNAAACAALALGMALAALPAFAQRKPAAAAKDDPQAATEGEGKDGHNSGQKKKLSPAEAQAAVDAAERLLEAGKAEAAAQALTRTLAAGHLPPAVMAKALLYRGTAYRQQNMPAQAIADLTSALWLKGGLGDRERADALRQRAAAYAEAGLAEGAGGAAAPASGASASGWNLFGDLFGGSSPPAAPPSQPPPAAPQRPAPSPRATGEAALVQGGTTGGWSRNTQVRGSPAEIATAATPAKPEGRFHIQIGMVRTHDQAEEMASRVKSRFGDAVGQREPEIDEAVVGNMGSFYRVRVGPYASLQEGQAACSRLKGSGLDCLVVAP